jgi:lysophospholipase L1-like esterase
MIYFTLLIIISLYAAYPNCIDLKPDKINSMSKGKIEILALGDSYTIGEKVAESARWLLQLVEELRRHGFDPAEPRIIAETGWTTDELISAIEAARITEMYDIVTLLIGVNNQYRGRDTAEYRTEFKKLLNLAKVFAIEDPERIVVLSIPDWGVTPFAEGRDRDKISEEIDLFNSINREETESLGAYYLDITEISRREGNRSGYLAEDGLHPSGKMYREWVKLLLPLVLQILESKN